MAHKTDPKVIQFVNKVKKKYKLERAIFFGSRARGDHLLHSDYDLILVSADFEGVFFTERMAKMYDFWTDPMVLEAFCYTPAEFEIKRKQIGTVATAVKEGIEIAV